MDIVMELCDGTVVDYKDDPEKFPKFSNLTICLQSANGINYLHNEMTKTRKGQWCVAHKDIKPTNILLCNKDGNVKLADFHISKTIDQEKQSFENTSSSTKEWAAPKLLRYHYGDSSNGNNYIPLTQSYDIFSLGCVFWYIFTSEHPFKATEKNSVVQNIMNSWSTLSQFDPMSPIEVELLDIVKNMICENPEKRPIVETILKHPLFWNASQRLELLRKVNDSVNPKPKSVEILNSIRKIGNSITGSINWIYKLEPEMQTHVKKKKYKSAFEDLLRCIRNNWQHIDDQPTNVQFLFGSSVDDKEKYISYWMEKFPKLIIMLYNVEMYGKVDEAISNTGNQNIAKPTLSKNVSTNGPPKVKMITNSNPTSISNQNDEQNYIYMIMFFGAFSLSMFLLGRASKS